MKLSPTFLILATSLFSPLYENEHPKRMTIGIIAVKFGSEIVLTFFEDLHTKGK
jgi:hypothetical protein